MAGIPQSLVFTQSFCFVGWQAAQARPFAETSLSLFFPFCNLTILGLLSHAPRWCLI